MSASAVERGFSSVAALGVSAGGWVDSDILEVDGIGGEVGRYAARDLRERKEDRVDQMWVSGWLEPRRHGRSNAFSISISTVSI